MRAVATLVAPLLVALAATCDGGPGGEPTCEDELRDCQELVTGECDWANDNRYRMCLACREDTDTCNCILLDERGDEVVHAEGESCSGAILGYCEYES